MKPTITIAVPSFNSETYIEEAILSIINQSYPVDNIIVIDDCSNDETVPKVKNMQKSHPDSNLELIRNVNNLGYQRNWNKCLDSARTEFVLLLHADDILISNAVEKHIQFFQEHPSVSLVGGHEDIVDENGVLKKENKSLRSRVYNVGEIYEFILDTLSYIACSTVMFNMKKIKHVGYFEENIMATDELYWPSVLTKYPIAIIGDSLVKRRIHSNQAEYSDFKNKYIEVINSFNKQIEIIPSYEDRIIIRAKIIKILKKKSSSASLRISRILIISGDITLSMRYFLQSIKYYPATLFGKRLWKSVFYLILKYCEYILFGLSIYKPAKMSNQYKV